MSHLYWYAVIDLENVYFFISVNKQNQKQITFTGQGQQISCIPLLLPQGYVNSSANCHRPEDA